MSDRAQAMICRLVFGVGAIYALAGAGWCYYPAIGYARHCYAAALLSVAINAWCISRDK